ncbi:MAG: helix-turn-helix domain-containing protein [Lachnospirales bacterium]
MARIQLDYKDRLFIEESLRNGVSIVEIAYKLDKSVTTIYSELNRGDTGNIDENYKKIYSAKLGHQTYLENKSRCGRKTLW